MGEKAFNGRLTEAELLDIGSATVERPNDPIDSIFGDEQSDNLFARWEMIASEYGVPVMAYYHAMDAETRKATRVPIDTRNIEKGKIAVKLDQSERMRALERAGLRREDPQFREGVQRDAINLVQQVVTRSKIAKYELLATGKVTIQENNLNLTVDFGVPADQNGFTMDLNSGADVSAEIEAIVSAAREKGVQLTGMMCSNRVYSTLRRNQTLRSVINNPVNYGAIISTAALYDYFSSEFGFTQILTSDMVYALDGGVDTTTGRPVRTMKRAFPEDRISFFAANPAGRVGTGLWGVPGEADLDGYGARVSTSGESPYVYLTQWAEKDPPILWTKASALFMPVLYLPSSLWISTVTGLNAVTALTVTSAAGSASGKTAITVSPAKAAQTNVYKYKVSTAAAPAVTEGQNVAAWTTWDGSADITAKTGAYITVAETDAAYKVLKAGSATVTSA